MEANLIAGSTLQLAGSCAGDEAMHGQWRDGIRRLATAGFTAIDLIDAWVSPAGLSDDALDLFAEILADEGMALAGVSVIRKSVIDPADGERNLDETLRAIAGAARLGATTVSIGFHRPLTPMQRDVPFWTVPAPADNRSDAAWALAGKRVAELADAASAEGIEIALELHEATLLDGAAGALRVIAEAGRENIGVNLDIGNLIRVPTPLAESWEATVTGCLGRVSYWHVKNYARLEQPLAGVYAAYPVALEAGWIDYRRALGLVLGAGYTGSLCIEHYGGDAWQALVSGRRYLESLLAERAQAVAT